MVTKEEIEIFKKILINKTFDEINALIGFEQKGKNNKSTVLEENSWINIKSSIIKKYKLNIQNPKYNKLRKKIELINAKLGFVVPQNILLAKEKKQYEIKPIDHKKTRIKKHSESKILEKEKSFKKSIYIYFQSILYEKDIFEVYKTKDGFENIKNYLKELFKNHDNVICKKIEKAESFSSLFYSLPKDKEKTKKICKLVEFDKKTNKKREQTKSQSIRAISIPMGGQ